MYVSSYIYHHVATLVYMIFNIKIIITPLFSVNLDEQYSRRIDAILSKLENICDEENSRNENDMIFSEIEMKNGNALKYGKEN